MTVSLLSVLTVIAAIWWVFIFLWAIAGDDLACILGPMVMALRGLSKKTGIPEKYIIPKRYRK